MAKKELNYSALDALLHFKTTKVFCADYLGISEDTIERRLREDYNMTFKEYHKLRMGKTATRLQQEAINQALKGNTVMLIFCLKNLCGWKDKHEQEIVTDKIPAFKIVKDETNKPV